MLSNPCNMSELDTTSSRGVEALVERYSAGAARRVKTVNTQTLREDRRTPLVIATDCAGALATRVGEPHPETCCGTRR